MKISYSYNMQNVAIKLHLPMVSDDEPNARTVSNIRIVVIKQTLQKIDKVSPRNHRESHRGFI